MIRFDVNFNLDGLTENVAKVADDVQRNAALSAHWRRGPTGRLLVSTTGESPCLMYCWNWIACT